jgi:ABC-2 type transport system permease protein/oleandomycin transport system permease protein
MLLILAFGYSFGWVMLTLGMLTKDPAAATSAATGPTFLLLFASNALVPTDTLPGWLQGFAANQPLSVTVSAVRALFLGGDATKYVWQALAWAVAITVAFFLTSVGLYKSAAAK